MDNGNGQPKKRFYTASEKPKSGFTLANSQNKPKQFFRRKPKIKVLSRDQVKPTEEIKIVVDSFHTNGTFDEEKYNQWTAKIRAQIEEKMTIRLSNKDRAEIREEMFNRTQEDLKDINF